MNITVNSLVLAQELRLLEKIINPKITSPVLQNALFVANDALHLAATDLEIGLMTTCDARVSQHGRITLPVKKLLDLVNQMPDDDVNISVDHHHVHVTCGGFRSRLQGMSANDFPAQPDVEGTAHQIELSTLRLMIDRVKFATSEKNVRYFMSGAQMRFTDKAVLFVATDSRRLSISTSKHHGTAADAVIIPNKMLNLLSTIEGETTVNYTPAERHLFFEVSPRVFYTRMVDGKFPDYQRVIPRNHPIKINIARSALAAALRRVSLVADQNKAIYFSFDNTGLHLSASSATIGEADEHLAFDCEHDVKICVNWQHVLEFLDAAQEPLVTLELKDERASLLLTDGPDFFNVVMPMRL